MQHDAGGGMPLCVYTCVRALPQESRQMLSFRDSLFQLTSIAFSISVGSGCFKVLYLKNSHAEHSRRESPQWGEWIGFLMYDRHWHRILVSDLSYLGAHAVARGNCNPENVPPTNSCKRYQDNGIRTV